MMHVELVNRQKDVDVRALLPHIPLIVSTVLEMEKTSCDHICIQFLSATTMRRYHAKFFQDNTITDCMSFPLDSDMDVPLRCLGEILVCPLVALRYVRSQLKRPTTLPTVYSEITLYIVHGLLHLLGYDDIHEKDETIMRKKEHEAMKRIHAKNILYTETI